MNGFGECSPTYSRCGFSNHAPVLFKRGILKLAATCQILIDAMTLAKSLDIFASARCDGYTQAGFI